MRDSGSQFGADVVTSNIEMPHLSAIQTLCKNPVMNT